MSDLRKQIHDYYQDHELPAGKVEAILAQGRGADTQGHVADKIVPLRHAPPKWRLLALAASVMMTVGLAVWWPQGQGNKVSMALLPPRIVEFFQTPPQLPKMSQSPAELREWLLAQGAPADYHMPATLQGMESLGCKVVDVHGRRAWLACFWREKKPDGSGGELVHLWAVRRSDFKDGPPIGTRQFHEESGWSFGSWTEGDMMYTVAANAPLEKLRPFVVEATERASTSVVLVFAVSGF